jgi:type II secretory pathway component GspD/PulD (secretin)
MKEKEFEVVIIVWLFFVLLFVSFGCKSVQKKSEFPGIENYQFQTTPELDIVRVEPPAMQFDVRFDGVPFGQAMSIVSQKSGATIVWGSELDEKLVVGTFESCTLSTILNVVARRSGASLAEIGGVYYVGSSQKTDRVIAVVRVPPADVSQVLEAVKSSLSELGSCSLVGSCLWVSDSIESVRKALSGLDMIRERSNRSYVAEVFFLRMVESDFLKLQANLEIQQIDIFASSFNVDQLFQMFVDGDGAKSKSSIDQRPVLYLTEGRPAVFEDGSDIVLEQKSVSQEGYATTTGYQTFSDGLRLEICLNRVSSFTYSVSIDLSVSSFTDEAKTSGIVPKTSRSSINNPGLLVSDGQVFYVGSLKRKNRNNSGGIFSYNYSKTDDLLTVWVCVRELHRNL